jgi:hypothetical protein
MQQFCQGGTQFALIAMLLVAVLTGCSGRPSAIPMIDVDPAAAAERAVKTYDANGDGKLADAELRNVPGILKWKSLYDLDSDGFVSEQEIAERLAKWQTDNVGFRSISVNVKLDDRPVSNVRVTLTPEPYLGDAVKRASGTTNERGYASLSVTPEDLPEVIKQRGIKVGGVYPGTYKIALAHPQLKLPETDSRGAPLGDEIARDTVDSSMEIVLSSR